MDQSIRLNSKVKDQLASETRSTGLGKVHKQEINQQRQDVDLNGICGLLWNTIY